MRLQVRKHTKQASRNRRWNHGYQRLGEGWDDAYGDRASFWGDGNVMELDRGGG